jgi:hypothetical protein
VAAVTVSSEARVEVAPISVERTPRAITAEVRKRVGLPRSDARYPWARAVIATGVFGVPLALAGWASLTAVIALVALIVLPAWRAVERREAAARERLYVHGDEAVARVLEIEPAGAGRRDHVVHVEYFVGDARHEAKIVAAPLARHGLRPGDDASVVYDPKSPTRCLLVQKIARAPRVEAPPSAEIFDAVFDEDPITTGGCGHGCGCR